MLNFSPRYDIEIIFALSVCADKAFYISTGLLLIADGGSCPKKGEKYVSRIS